MSKAIETANHDAITSSFPYYAAFNHPVPSYHLSIPDLFELGERRVKELDAAGIDMEVLSYVNVTRWFIIVN